MKRKSGFFFNIALVLVGTFFIFQYFQSEFRTTSSSEPIVSSLKIQDFDEAFRALQQVTLDEEELIIVKDELLLQTIKAKDEFNEERLLLLKALVENSPVLLDNSFHMPILNNIQIYLDYLDLQYVLDCHELSDSTILDLRQATTLFISSIQPYYRDGLVQALNTAREHYNDAITLEIEACYSPINYIGVLESGLTFMKQTLEDPRVNNYNDLRMNYLEVLNAYDKEKSDLMKNASNIKSKLNTLNLHQERYQEKINQINR